MKFSLNLTPLNYFINSIVILSNKKSLSFELNSKQFKLNSLMNLQDKTVFQFITLPSYLLDNVIKFFHIKKVSNEYLRQRSKDNKMKDDWFSVVKTTFWLQVKVQVIDVNDNAPEFVFPNINLTQSRYFASVPKTIPFSSTVLQIDAYDRDSGKYGKLEYKLLNDQTDNYFTIDSATGIIRTTTSLNNIRKEQLPFRFKVQVKDNPNSTTNANVNEAPVIVNLIDNENLLVMTIQNAVSENLQKDGQKIVQITQEKTGLLIGIHNIVARKNVTVNGTVETYPLDSDVWFYAVDPETEMILNRNDTRMKR